MGQCFKQIESLINNFDGEILEIGTERYEGSSVYFSTLAKKNNKQFITVDIDSDSGNILKETNVGEHIFYNMSGSTFVIDVLPTLNIKIKVLYLDNYDWNWNINEETSDIQDQKRRYQTEFGLEMNNLESQTEHLRQMINILPYMLESSVICLDDTYRFNDVFIGKSGAVVPYLIINNYQIVAEDNYCLIMQRGKQ